MKAATIGQLALLPEEEAVQRHFDAINYRRFHLFLIAAAIYAFPLAAILSSRGFSPQRDPQALPLAIAHVVLTAAFFLLRKSAPVARRFRKVLLGWIVAEFLIISTMFTTSTTVSVNSMLIFPLAVLLLRLRRSEYLALATVFATTAFVIIVVMDESPRRAVFTKGVPPFVANAVWAGAAILLARSERRRFVGDWSVLASREHERRRMQDELDVARQIQIAMLPACSPSLDWIDVCSLSQPASEVGGDFFDYHVLRDGRLALVIGDVAGHGLPSGLVLSAVRGGLYLLREQLDDPRRAFADLDAMVRDAIRWRMLVSLLVAVVDPRAGRVRVIAAGHPPLLLVRRSGGAVVRVGTGSLPLGTNLSPSYTADEHPIASGDTLVMVTDGITEASREGEMFGDERLAAIVAREAGGGAENVRDAVVSEVARFREGAQQDDLTLLVARFR
jgi:hypothetical protein